MAKAWKSLECALQMMKKPFPKPWDYIEESRSGIGNIGAELDFGTVKFETTENGIKDVPSRILLFHCHKEVTGPVMQFWYVMWHKDYKFKEFDIRWIWQFLGESEPKDWTTGYENDFTMYTLDRLRLVREAFLRCPDGRRNEMVEKIGSGWFLDQEDPFPRTKNAPSPMPPCAIAQVAVPSEPTFAEQRVDLVYASFEKLGERMAEKARGSRDIARQARKRGDTRKWDKFNAIARVYEMASKEMWSCYQPLSSLTSKEFQESMIPF